MPANLWHNLVTSAGWLRSVGSIKLYVSFAEHCLFKRALLQEGPIILSILLTKATLCVHIHIYTYANTYTRMRTYMQADTLSLTHTLLSHTHTNTYRLANSWCNLQASSTEKHTLLCALNAQTHTHIHVRGLMVQPSGELYGETCKHTCTLTHTRTHTHRSVDSWRNLRANSMEKGFWRCVQHSPVRTFKEATIGCSAKCQLGMWS